MSRTSSASPPNPRLNLSTHVLTASPSTQVYEEDEPWDFDTLLNDIAQEIQKDLDEKEELVRLGSQDSLHLTP